MLTETTRSALVGHKKSSKHLMSVLLRMPDPVSTDHEDGLTGEWQNPGIIIASSHDLMAPTILPW